MRAFEWGTNVYESRPTISSLESLDYIYGTFERLHARKASASRVRSISASAKQAREYFAQALASSFYVKPLLTFYGVASLTRAMTVLLSRQGGEEALTQGHGLVTAEWKSVLTSDIGKGVSNLGNLVVKTSKGLFLDQISATRNRISIEGTARRPWVRYKGSELPCGKDVKLIDLILSIPDLQDQIWTSGLQSKFGVVSDISFLNGPHNRAPFIDIPGNEIGQAYEAMGYKVADGTIQVDRETFVQNPPQMMSDMRDRTANTQVVHYITIPLLGQSSLSQLSITFIASFYMGMLARYYPTHWVALIDGVKGDSFSPILKRLQKYIDNNYPDLVATMIDDFIVAPDF